MPVGNVTTIEVHHLAPQRGNTFLWDKALPGFGVRVTQGGAKSYIYQYRLGGRGSISRRLTIGRHRAPWTAQSARNKALCLARQVAKGRDPLEKRRERRRKQVELRFDRYVELFTEEYLKRRWKDWSRIRSMLVHYAVPMIGTKRISEVRRSDLTAIYRRLENRPSVARAMHATLRKMFKWAMSRDDLKHSPTQGVDATPPPKPRNRYLSTEELRCAWKTSFQLTGQYGSAFRLMILTGQRRGEVIGLDWSELRREGGRWDLPAERSKNGRPHLIPLSKQAIALLDAVADGKDWPSHGLVFQSSCGTRLSAFSKAKEKWDAMIVIKMSSAGEEGAVLAPWRIHDIRRTVATGMQALQIRTEIIESVLNHLSGTKSGIVGVYQCYPYQAEKRQAMKRWGRHIKKLTAS